MNRDLTSEISRFKNIFEYSTKFGIENSLIMEANPPAAVEEPIVKIARAAEERLLKLRTKNPNLFNTLDQKIQDRCRHYNLPQGSTLRDLARLAAERGAASVEASSVRSIVKDACAADKKLAKAVGKLYVRDALKYYIKRRKLKIQNGTSDNPWLDTMTTIKQNLGDNVAYYVENEVRNNKTLKKVVKEEDIDNITAAQIESWASKNLPLPKKGRDVGFYVPTIVRFTLQYYWNGIMKSSKKLEDEVLTLTREIDAAAEFDLSVGSRIETLLTKVATLVGKTDMKSKDAFGLYERFVSKNPDFENSKAMKDVIAYLNDNKSQFKGLFEKEWLEQNTERAKKWYAAKGHFDAFIESLPIARIFRTDIEVGKGSQLLKLLPDFTRWGNYLMYHDTRTKQEIARALATRGPVKSLLTKMVFAVTANYLVIPALKAAIISIKNNIGNQLDVAKKAYEDSKAKFDNCKKFNNTLLKINKNYPTDKLAKCDDINPEKLSPKALTTSWTELFPQQVNSFFGLFGSETYGGGGMVDLIKKHGFEPYLQGTELVLCWTAVDDLIVELANFGIYLKNVQFDENKFKQFLTQQEEKLNGFVNSNMEELKKMGWDETKNWEENVAALNEKYKESEITIEKNLRDAKLENDTTKKNKLYWDAFKQYCYQNGLEPINKTGTDWDYSKLQYFIAQDEKPNEGVVVKPKYYVLNSLGLGFDEAQQEE